MARIFVAGHRGMVGSALVRRLSQAGHEIVTRDRATLDLTDQQGVREFFRKEKVDEVYVAAAKVGGIWANSQYPADFIYQNLQIQTNVIHAAHMADVQRLLFLGSSCIYPKFAEQPIREAALLTGALEPTNEPYAIAKIAGLKMCESYNQQYGRDYRSVMPTNLYGPGDNFNLQNSHVIPALMRRFHDAKLKGDAAVQVWGTGKPRREFLHVDDLALACEFVMNLPREVYAGTTDERCGHINVGSGVDHTIAELASLISEVVGYKGEITFDPAKPDGTPRKLLDVSLLARLGWTSSIPLREGLAQVYSWFLENHQ